MTEEGLMREDVTYVASSLIGWDLDQPLIENGAQSLNMENYSRGTCVVLVVHVDCHFFYRGAY